MKVFLRVRGLGRRIAGIRMRIGDGGWKLRCEKESRRALSSKCLLVGTDARAPTEHKSSVMSVDVAPVVCIP